MGEHNNKLKRKHKKTMFNVQSEDGVNDRSTNG